MQRPQFLLHKRHFSEFPFKVDLLSNSMQLTLISYEYTYVYPVSLRSFYATRPGSRRRDSEAWEGREGAAAVGTRALL